MAGIVFGDPLSPPPAPFTWTGLDMTWTGWDGSVWNLSNGSDGTVMMAGVRGMNMPPVQHYTAEHAGTHGARWRGHTVQSREVFWPLQVYSDQGSIEWLERDRAFWKTMRPDKPGVWTVTRPDGQKRSLTLRFQDDGTQTYNTDPSLAGWSNYGITLMAEQPYWAGETETGSWVAGNAVQFFPNLTISPGGTLASAQLRNPGDVDAWPIWNVYGPTSSVTVGINGRNITVPFALLTGQVLTIDTSPRQQTAILDGITDKTAQLGVIDFAPLPADQISTLTLSVTGSGFVTATVTPLYLRAW